MSSENWLTNPLYITVKLGISSDLTIKKKKKKTITEMNCKKKKKL